MPVTTDSRARTRAFARVLGPFLTIVPATVAVRMGTMNELLTGFFENPAVTWIIGAILLFAGLFIIANHQIWSSAPAIVISVLGWLFALRGVVLLAAPGLLERVAAALIGATTPIRIAFALLALIGAWLTYTGWLVRERSEP
jgi:hypothetical protein